MPGGRHSIKYNMRHRRRGVALVLTHNTLKVRPKKCLCVSDGVDSCRRLFSHLGFEVTIGRDLRTQSILQSLQLIAAMDHRECDGLVVMVMTHGTTSTEANREVVWVPDDEINTEDIWRSFTPDLCPSLKGKPKLFFFQVCQGEGADEGVQLQHQDNDEDTQADTRPGEPSREDFVIPPQGDMLLMHASCSGKFTIRSGNSEMRGSTFLHFLTQVLTRESRRKDLATMLQKVTGLVSTHFTTSASGGHKPDNNTHIPYMISTLKGKIYFFARDRRMFSQVFRAIARFVDIASLPMTSFYKLL
ncbi:caspase-like [Homarus americanus]|uniref:caspase-like n=1 Tax=Homarus americanus TaxID=6706 RepID=UPI001C47F177|nr:caspase-like [Homarus americanus]